MAAFDAKAYLLATYRRMAHEAADDHSRADRYMDISSALTDWFRNPDANLVRQLEELAGDDGEPFKTEEGKRVLRLEKLRKGGVAGLLRTLIDREHIGRDPHSDWGPLD